MADNKEFAKVLILLASSFPRFTLTKETIEVYSQLLSDIPIETLRAAAIQCARKCTFFPSVHELMDEVIIIEMKAENIPSVYEAFAETVFAKNDHTWSHPLVKKVAYDLGWQYSWFPGESTNDDQYRFYKAYNQAVQDIVQDKYSLPEMRNLIDAPNKQRLSEGKNETD